MKNILFILALATCTLSFLIYEVKRNPFLEITSASVLPTSIKISRTLIDVGNQNIHSNVTGKYTIYNVGDQSLFISDVKPDCHCTVVEFPKNAILPKDSAIVKLKYDAANYGIFQSSAIMSTNSDPANIILVLRGQIIENR